MNTRLKAIIAGVLLAAVVMSFQAALASFQINGRNSQSQQQILQGGIMAVAADLGVTATPSGTITTSYQIINGFTEVSTVASGGDAVKLPDMNAFVSSGLAGHSINIFVGNDGANSLNLFPFKSTEVIINNGSAASAGAALAIPANKSAECQAAPNATTPHWFCQVQ